MTGTITTDADSYPGMTELEPARRATPVWLKPVEWVAVVFFLIMSGMILTNVFTRYVFGHPIVWADEVASLSFMWMAMLGAVLAIERSEHMRLTVLLPLISDRWRPYVEAFSGVLMLVFLGGIMPSALEYAYEESYITSPALNMPMIWRASALPTGVILMALLVVVHLLRDLPIKAVGAALGVAAVLVGGLYLASPALAALGNWNLPIYLGLIVFVCLGLGVPIAFCFGLGTLAYITFATSRPVFVMIGRIDEGMSSLILLSVPIFVFLGCILDATGMGKAIVGFLASLLGHVKAGMRYVLLGALFLVSGISGSKVSDMATVAPALFPEMKRRGNKPSEMIALLATGAAMADTVPPSIVLIVLGSAAGVSIAGLFTAGFAIAMILLLVLAVLARWKARDESMEGVRRAPLSVVAKTLLVAAPALVLPFLIRAFVGGGIATATEVSTVAVVYALLIGMVIYGGIKPAKLGQMLVDTAAMSGAVLLILGTASAMAWALTQSGFAAGLAEIVTNLPGGWLSFMFASIAIFLVLGCVLEGLPALVLMAPIMFPLARNLGIHDIHYSMVIVVAMNIGMMAPPIGVGFYIACKIGNVPPIRR
ncbi:TRAP transporter large permease subunit [Paracoccus cavernae]|uniref:TRAP transporter large permease subunit n=1 Tax=Paracoccus cavernae TaxID=1571207 RepID=A0ABT8D336_9RHOB|nr:TRAP transporter large permease subunit [Paracoccus cavernae]